MKKYLFIILLSLLSFNLYAQPSSFDEYELLCVSMVDDAWEKDVFYRVEYLESIDMIECYSELFLISKNYHKVKTKYLVFDNVLFTIDIYVNCEKKIILTTFNSSKNYIGIIVEAINPKYTDEFPYSLIDCINLYVDDP